MGIQVIQGIQFDFIASGPGRFAGVCPGCTSNVGVTAMPIPLARCTQAVSQAADIAAP